MARLTILLYALINLTATTGISFAQNQKDCAMLLGGNGFDGEMDIKILVTGFGPSDGPADLFGNRYALALQSYIGTGKGSGNSAGLTLQGRIVRYLPCDVSSHSRARQLGQQLGADLVLWGQVEWRQWQGAISISAPKMPSDVPPVDGKPLATDPAPPPPPPSPAPLISGQVPTRQIVNNFSAAVHTIVQGTPGQASAMLIPHLTSVKWINLEVDADYPIQITDHRDLKSETVSTLLHPSHLALIHLLLGLYAADKRQDERANSHFDFMVQYSAGEHLRLLNKARDAVTLLEQVGTSLVRSKNFSIGSTLLQRASSRCDSADIHCSAEIHETLAWAFTEQTATDEAISNYTSALDLWKRTQKKERIAAVHLKLGALFRDKKEYEDAIFHFRKQIAIVEKMGNKDLSELAVGLTNLAAAYTENDQPKKAVSPMERALKIYEKSHSLSPHKLAEKYHDLGRLYENTGRDLDAISQYVRELRIWDELKETKHVANALRVIADAYSREGDIEEAVSRYEEAASYFQTSSPPDIMQTRSSLTSALSLCKKLGQPEESDCSERINKKKLSLPAEDASK